MLKLSTKVTRDISYNPPAVSRGVGDLFLPDKVAGHPVLLIHGGGWNALTKESIEPLARWLADHGRAVFSINYRLLDHSPWPACGDDCIAAGRFMLDGKLASHDLPAPTKILIAGASAGGHLAMMTGLGLPAGTVEAMVSLAGPSLIDFPDGSSSQLGSDTFHRRFFGTPAQPTSEQIEAVSPAKLAKPGVPPLYCIHSTNDQLVKPTHSELAAAAWRRVKSRARVITFNGAGDSHGFWDSENHAIRRPIPEVVNALDVVLKELA